MKRPTLKTTISYPDVASDAIILATFKAVFRKGQERECEIVYTEANKDIAVRRGLKQIGFGGKKIMDEQIKSINIVFKSEIGKTLNNENCKNI